MNGEVREAVLGLDEDGIGVLFEDVVAELMALTELDESGAELLVLRAAQEGEVEMRLRAGKVWTIEATG